MIADQETVGDRDALAKQVATLGADLVLDSLRESPGVPRHDPILLAGAFRTAFSRPPAGERIPFMAMTGAVKDELARLPITKPCCRKAEVSAILRFAGGLHLVSGHIVLESELDTGAAARRLRKDIAEVYGHSSDLVRAGGWRVYAKELATSSGSCVTAPRSLVRPASSMAGDGRCAGFRRKWCQERCAMPSPPGEGRSSPTGHSPNRGARRPWRSLAPGPEAALALVGAARRLGIGAKAREVRGVDRVVIRDGDAISAMLTRLGAHDSVLAWEDRRMRREVRATANRLANFDDANLRRSARAAVAAGARVERALEILG